MPEYEAELRGRITFTVECYMSGAKASQAETWVALGGVEAHSWDSKSKINILISGAKWNVRAKR
jgi:hypothetical protein